MSEIPASLSRRSVSLRSLLHQHIDELTFTQTLSKEYFSERRLNPAIEHWTYTTTKSILDGANNELKKINNQIIMYNTKNQSLANTQNIDKKIDNFRLATKSTGAAMLGIPLLASFSTQSAGWLGLLGATAISWPLTLGGSAIFGSIALIGGYRKTKSSLKKTVEELINNHILGNDPNTPSLRNRLQKEIKSTADSYLQEIKYV